MNRRFSPLLCRLNLHIWRFMEEYRNCIGHPPRHKCIRCGKRVP